MASSHIDNTLPDIYYIILDGYGRSDVLQELYDYNNSQFISSLEDKGFVVATDSHSNYIHTTLSLASPLIWIYRDNIGDGIGEDYQSLEPTAEMIRHSRLRAFLEERGYQSVAFQTGSGHTMIMGCGLLHYLPSKHGKRFGGIADYQLRLADVWRKTSKFIQSLYMYWTPGQCS